MVHTTHLPPLEILLTPMEPHCPNSLYTTLGMSVQAPHVYLSPFLPSSEQLMCPRHMTRSPIVQVPRTP
jgi:hypothetical protein